MLDKVRLVEEVVKYESYHIILPNIQNKYYNNDSLNKLEELLEVINIDNEEELIAYKESNEEIRKVVKLIMELSRQEELQGWYDKEKDRQMLEEGLREEIKEKAKKEGFENGKKEEKITIAKNMLNEHVDISIISKVTGLSIEEINNLK